MVDWQVTLTMAAKPPVPHVNVVPGVCAMTGSIRSRTPPPPSLKLRGVGKQRQIMILPPLGGA
jgi:hypothetical protein